MVAGDTARRSRHNSLGTREKLSEVSKRKWQDPEYRAKQLAALNRGWQDPEYRAKHLALLSGREIKAETREKLSALDKRRWQDPEYRAKQTASRSAIELKAEIREKLSALGKRKWQDPEYRAKQTATLIRRREIKAEARGKMSEADKAKAGERQLGLLPRILPVESKVEPISSSHYEYIKSGVWQCPQSTTGAHYWIIRDEWMRCKHCGQKRRVKR
jgi:hypothetical protein